MLKTVFLLLLLLITFFQFLRLEFNDGVRVVEKVNIIILLIIGIILITNPFLLSWLCDILNIKRPIDLYLYISILANTWFAIRTHLRINRLETKISKIVSYLALEESSNKR